MSDHDPRTPRGPKDLTWHKSSRSNSSACVEVAFAESLVLMRDTKDREGPVLRFTFAEWDAFLGGVRDGQFDRS